MELYDEDEGGALLAILSDKLSGEIRMKSVTPLVVVGWADPPATIVFIITTTGPIHQPAHLGDVKTSFISEAGI